MYSAERHAALRPCRTLRSRVTVTSAAPAYGTRPGAVIGSEYGIRSDRHRTVAATSPRLTVPPHRAGAQAVRLGVLGPFKSRDRDPDSEPASLSVAAPPQRRVSSVTPADRIITES
eukprot:369903-Hanusia_phi.AAC.2